MLTKDESYIIEELINEEVLSCLRGGMSLNDNYIVILRGLLSKFNLKETYNFERYREDSE